MIFDFSAFCNYGLFTQTTARLAVGEYDYLKGNKKVSAADFIIYLTKNYKTVMILRKEILHL